MRKNSLVLLIFVVLGVLMRIFLSPEETAYHVLEYKILFRIDPNANESSLDELKNELTKKTGLSLDFSGSEFSKSGTIQSLQLSVEGEGFSTSLSQSPFVSSIIFERDLQNQSSRFGSEKDFNAFSLPVIFMKIKGQSKLFIGIAIGLILAISVIIFTKKLEFQKLIKN